MKTKIVHFLVRLLALAVDLLIADIVIIAAIRTTGHSLGDVNPILLTALVLALWFVVLSSIFISQWGKTPGMWLVNVKVTGHNGGRINFWQAVARRPKAVVSYENPGMFKIVAALAIVILFYGGGLISLLR